MLAQARKSTAPFKAASRQRKQAAGFYETTVFVHETAKVAIDRFIAEGRFKTRREAMEHAIHSVFHAEESATSPR